MKVLIDGKEVPCNNDVKVIYDDLFVYGDDGEELKGELHLTLTHQGEITDVFAKHPNYDESLTTTSETAQDIVDTLI